MMVPNKNVISMHWHRERNKKSFGVRAVQSNAFIPTLFPKNKNEKTAFVNSVYASLYGLGSDAFNRFFTRFSPTGPRPASSKLVFSEMMHLTVLLDVWSILQQNGSYVIEGTGPSYGAPFFEKFLTDLSRGLLNYATTLVSNSKVLPDARNSGCGCDTCKEITRQTSLRVILERNRAIREREKDHERKEREKEKKREEKERRAREKEEKERRRREAKEKGVQTKDTQGRARETTRTTRKTENCLQCKKVLYGKVGLKCVFCGGIVCPKCHGFRTRAVSVQRATYWCGTCEKEAQE